MLLESRSTNLLTTVEFLQTRLIKEIKELISDPSNVTDYLLHASFKTVSKIQDFTLNYCIAIGVAKIYYESKAKREGLFINVALNDHYQINNFGIFSRWSSKWRFSNPCTGRWHFLTPQEIDGLPELRTSTAIDTNTARSELHPDVTNAAATSTDATGDSKSETKNVSCFIDITETLSYTMQFQYYKYLNVYWISRMWIWAKCETLQRAVGPVGVAGAVGGAASADITDLKIRAFVNDGLLKVMTFLESNYILPSWSNLGCRLDRLLNRYLNLNPLVDICLEYI